MPAPPPSQPSLCSMPPLPLGVGVPPASCWWSIPVIEQYVFRKLWGERVPIHRYLVRSLLTEYRHHHDLTPDVVCSVGEGRTPLTSTSAHHHHHAPVPTLQDREAALEAAVARVMQSVVRMVLCAEARIAAYTHAAVDTHSPGDDGGIQRLDAHSSSQGEATHRSPSLWLSGSEARDASDGEAASRANNSDIPLSPAGGAEPRTPAGSTAPIDTAAAFAGTASSVAVMQRTMPASASLWSVTPSAAVGGGGVVYRSVLVNGNGRGGEAAAEDPSSWPMHVLALIDNTDEHRTGACGCPQPPQAVLAATHATAYHAYRAHMPRRFNGAREGHGGIAAVDGGGTLSAFDADCPLRPRFLPATLLGRSNDATPGDDFAETLDKATPCPAVAMNQNPAAIKMPPRAPKRERAEDGRHSMVSRRHPPSPRYPHSRRSDQCVDLTANSQPSDDEVVVVQRTSPFAAPGGRKPEVDVDAIDVE